MVCGIYFTGCQDEYPEAWSRGDPLSQTNLWMLLGMYVENDDFQFQMELAIS